MLRPSLRLAAITSVIALVAAACGGDNGSADTSPSGPSPAPSTTEAPTTTAAPTTTEAPPATASIDGADPAEMQGGGIDLSLTRDDFECIEEELISEGEYLIGAHYVVDGHLGALCFGEEDQTIYQAWELLASITPGGQLHDLAFFSGFVAEGEAAVDTLAWVANLDEVGSNYQMSVNLNAADEDFNEFALTMAHEFAHVFTALPFELDRFTAPEDCPTYHNGDGCYYEDSLMAMWIADFWGDGLLDTIADPLGDEAGAEERCDLYPGFFGTYAANNPEEDFAEAFSAFVFQLPADNEYQQYKIDWMSQFPGLVEFREIAYANGLGPLDNNFNLCGVSG